MDVVSQDKRSKMMANIRSSNTKAEVIVRKLLHAQGFRYRLGTKIVDYTPDIVLSKYKVAVFVHGCFWHRHRGCKYATNPMTNSQKWQHKFGVNVERDRRVETALVTEGWRVAVIWECWTKRSLDISWLYSWIMLSNGKYVSWPNLHTECNNNQIL